MADKEKIHKVFEKYKEFRRTHSKTEYYGPQGPITPANIYVPVDWDALRMLLKARGMSIKQMAREMYRRKPEVFAGLDRASAANSIKSFVVLGSAGKVVGTSVERLILMAEVLGVAPETLVDTRRYFRTKERLYAGYKLAIRAAQLGVPYGDLLLGKTRDVYYRFDDSKEWRQAKVALVRLLRGNVCGQVRVRMLQEVCEKLGMHVAELFIPVVYGRSPTLVGALADAVQGIDTESAVLVYGLLRLLQSGLRGSELVQAFGELVERYGGQEEEEADGSGTATCGGDCEGDRRAD